MQGKPRLLLHVCCGPCSTVVLERLLPEYEVTALWYNPNIQPAEEHDLRLAGAVQASRHFGVETVVLPREEAAWLQAVRGLESEPEGGRRCVECFRHRIERAVREAAEGFTFVATTLTVGPNKPAPIINEIGRSACEGTGLGFLEADFKLHNGLARSVELGRSLGLHRQQYCGCRFAARR